MLIIISLLLLCQIIYLSSSGAVGRVFLDANLFRFDETIPLLSSSSSSSASLPKDNEQPTAVALDNDDNNNINNVIDPQSGELWIHVEDWREGMTAWRISFSEIATAAKELNATLVEPDVLDGRLVPKGRLPLSHFYNRSLIEDFFHDDQGNNRGRLATRQEYETYLDELNATGINVMTAWMCFRRCTPKYNCYYRRGDPKNPPCFIEDRELRGDYKQVHSDTLEEAIEAVASGKKVVLRIYTYSKNGLHEMKYGKDNKILSDRDTAGHFEKSRFQFTPPLHAALDSILRNAGVGQGKHAVIHWRGENPEMDYLECAKAIVDARTGMNLSPNTTVFLMSAIMSDASLQWGPNQRHTANTSAPAALEFLRSEKKFLPTEADVGQMFEVVNILHYVAIDVLLATSAEHFSTCAPQCKKKDYCSKCNRQSSFAGRLLGLRRQEGKKSSSCWNIPINYNSTDR